MTGVALSTIVKTEPVSNEVITIFHYGTYAPGRRGRRNEVDGKAIWSNSSRSMIPIRTALRCQSSVGR
jgi:hypothetical protein